MQTTWERLRAAVTVLAGAGSVKQRLVEAFQRHLGDLDPESLPRDQRAAYTTLVDALKSSRRTGSLDAVAASVLKMSEVEAGRHAQSIVQIFAALNESPMLGRATAVLRAVADDDEVPAFLNRA